MTTLIDNRVGVVATSHAIFLFLYGIGVYRCRLPRLRADLLVTAGVGIILVDARRAFSRPAVFRLDAVFRLPDLARRVRTDRPASIARSDRRVAGDRDDDPR